MNRITALVVAAGLAAGLATWAYGAGTQGSARFAGTVHVVEHANTDLVSNGKKADSVGNVLTFANPVFDQADAKRVGSDSGYCVRTVKGRSWECSWTTFLAAGQITVQGPFSDKGSTQLAITGGTGSYAHASGFMQLDYHDAKGTKFDFIFHLQ